MPVTTPNEMTVDEWRSEAIRRFGPDEMDWQWKCPSCGHVCTTRDYHAAGAKFNVVGYSCIGRFTRSPRDAFAVGPGPCNYAGGGLIGLNPVKVTEPNGNVHHMFEFGPGING